METNFENIGGSYSQQGDYLLPTLTLPDENQRQISVWAMRHRRYLKSNCRYEDALSGTYGIYRDETTYSNRCKQTY